MASEKLARQMDSTQVHRKTQGDLLKLLACRPQRSTLFPGKRSGHGQEARRDIHQALLSTNLVTTSAALVRRECFARAGGFDEQMCAFQDWELLLRISKFYAFRFIDAPLLECTSAGSISTNVRARMTALEMLLEKHGEEFAASPRLLARHHYTWAMVGTGPARWSEPGDTSSQLRAATPHTTWQRSYH